MWWVVVFNTLRNEAETKWQPFRRWPFQMHFLNGHVWIWIQSSLKFVPMGPINNIPAMVQIMAWRPIGDNPLSEPMLTRFTDAYMFTSSNGSIFRVTGPLCGEFTGEFPSQRPVTMSSDVFFDLRLNKRSSKQSRRWWFETPSCPSWRHRSAHAALGKTN